MKVQSTSDVSLEMLYELRTELSPDLELAVDERQIHLKSVESPSWITFLAEADWWVKIFAVYSALYVAELVKEAAKDTWKNRGRALSAVTATASEIKKLASGIARLRQRLSPKTRIRIALPIPSDYFSTSLELVGSEADELALHIALFVYHLPALMALIESEGLGKGRLLGAVQLKLLQNASLEVSWIDAQSTSRRRTVLSLTDGAGG